MTETSPRARAVPAGRIARLTRLGSLTTGIAGNMAWNGARALGRGERPGFRELLLTPGNVGRIAEDLARMRGAAMKLGQLVSMDAGEVLPPELAQILARLRADADTMPPRQLKSVLGAAWGPDWLRQFRHFDPRPIASASIGQVHRATLRDGRDLAIKVQYPGVARSIDSDVANVGALIRMSGLLPKGFELAPYLDEARRQLHEETDYAREASCLSRFRDLLGDDAGFVLPAPVPDWSGPSVLAMSYVAGGPIEAAEGLDQDARDRIAERLIALFLRELFAFRLMQTDPNFANYRFQSETGRIVLLDFGATRAFAPETVAGYRRLLSAGLAKDRGALDAAARETGLLPDCVAPRHRDRILTMIETVFDALLAGPVFDFESTDLAQAMQAEGTALAEDGFMPPPVPMDALYLQRKVGGLFLLCARLRARVPLARMLEAA